MTVGPFIITGTFSATLTAATARGHCSPEITCSEALLDAAIVNRAGLGRDGRFIDNLKISRAARHVSPVSLFCAVSTHFGVASWPLVWQIFAFTTPGGC